jgi:hypothetical protein
MKTIAAGILERVTQRLQQLISLGELAIIVYDPNDPVVGIGKFHEWRLASLSFLESVLGPTNRYYKFFEQHVGEFESGNSFAVEEGLGTLRGVKGELECGPLPQMEGLISGEIFEDFLDMAEHLLEQGYSEVAPSLIGAVLEDGLRRIAKNHGIPVREDSDSIGSLNTKLADGSVYSNFMRKKVALWNDTRNNADHGKFSQNTEQDVRQMLEGVRDFLGTHLT